MTSHSIAVRFWGVRGSIPCPGRETAGYGGNTSCVEIRCGESVFVFDAGSGLRLLGNDLMRSSTKHVELFLSHCHIDHLLGLPFFAPAFHPEFQIKIRAGGLTEPDGVKSAVEKLMSFPLFPIGADTMKAKISFEDFERGAVLQPREGVTIRTVALTHPGGATGYRLEFGGKAVCYVTDTELGDGEIAPALLALTTGADLLIMDATYTDAELPLHVGWGHSSWEETVAFANTVNVKKLCLFHHDPDHTDDVMDVIAADVARVRPGTVVAKEGLVIEV